MAKYLGGALILGVHSFWVYVNFCTCMMNVFLFETRNVANHIYFYSIFHLIFSDPTSQLGLASATESHWASGYNSSYAAASYAAASSFAYGGGAATGSADLAGQQAAISEQSAASSQIPTGMPNSYLFIYFYIYF